MQTSGWMSTDRRVDVYNCVIKIELEPMKSLRILLFSTIDFQLFLYKQTTKWFGIKILAGRWQRVQAGPGACAEEAPPLGANSAQCTGRTDRGDRADEWRQSLPNSWRGWKSSGCGARFPRCEAFVCFLTCSTFEFIVMSLFRGVLGLFCFKTLVRGIGMAFWYMWKTTSTMNWDLPFLDQQWKVRYLNN